MKLLTVLVLFMFIGIGKTLYAQEDDTQQALAQIDAYDSLGYVAASQHQYSLALEHYTKGLELSEITYGKQDTVTGIMLQRLAMTYMDMYDFVRAEGALIKSLEIVELHHGIHSKNYYEMSVQLLYTYTVTRNFEKANELIPKLTRILKTLYPNNKRQYAMHLEMLGGMEMYANSFEKALEYLLEANNTYDAAAANDEEFSARIINNIAYLYEQLGYTEDAEVMYLESKAIRAKIYGPQHPYYTITLNNLALFYTTAGRYKQAEQILDETQGIHEATVGKEHPNYGLMLHNRAYLYQKTDRLAEAEEAYLKSLKIKKNKGTNHPDYLRGLSNLAGVYYAQKKYKKAEATYLDLLKIYDNQLIHADMITAGMGALLMIYSGQKEEEKAQLMLQNSAQFAKEAYEEESSSMAAYYGRIAVYNNNNNDLERAKKFIYKALDSNSPVLDSTFVLADIAGAKFRRFPLAIENLEELGRIYLKEYENTSSKTHLEDYLALNQVIRTLNEGNKNELVEEEDKLSRLEERIYFTQNGIWAAQTLATLEHNSEYLKKAFGIAEQNKAVLLANALQSKRVHSFGDLPQDVAEKERKLIHQKAEIKKKMIQLNDQKQIFEMQQQLNQTSDKLEQLKKLIAEKYPKYHELRYAQHELDVASIQKMLPPKALLLEYFIADTCIYLFELTTESLNLRTIPFENAIWESKVEKFRKSISNYGFIAKEKNSAYSLYCDQAYWLYNQLLAKSLQNQSDIDRLIIVPDGLLGFFPFEALLTKAVKTNSDQLSYKQLPYLVNDFEVSYNYSASLWLETMSKISKSSKPGILAFAASYNTKDSTQQGFSNRSPYLKKLRKSLLPIPAVQSELEGLKEHYNGKYLFGEEANEKTFAAEAPNYSIIHLAMHGLVNHDYPLFSSLAFTENGDSLQDNFLQAYEVSQMNLEADLVVLSACETGYGKYQKGEGMASLARSFMYAGVPSLIVSLWQVNDGSTAVVMELFYKKLAEGMDKDAALREAKMAYIEIADDLAAHPAFWAPFIQIGNYNNIPIPQKGGLMNWLLLAGIALLGLGGLALMQRKKKANS